MGLNKVLFEKRLEGGEGVCPASNREKSVPERERHSDRGNMYLKLQNMRNKKRLISGFSVRLDVF